MKAMKSKSLPLSAAASIIPGMEIRPVHPQDLNSLVAIDGSIESSRYIHVDGAGEGLSIQWRLEERPLRQKRIDRNRPTDDEQFLLKQIVHGIDEGIALLAEHEDIKVALAVASRSRNLRR